MNTPAHPASGIRTASTVVLVLAVLALALPAEGASVTSIDTTAGAFGTQVTVNGEGFGEKAPKVYLSTVLQNGKTKKYKLKVLEHTDTRLVVLLKKALAGEYQLGVKVKGSKDIVNAPESFFVKLPENIQIEGLTFTPGGTLTITAEYLGEKKGKIYVGGKNAKVIEWVAEVEPVPGKLAPVGRVSFQIPKLPNGTVTVRIVTKHGNKKDPALSATFTIQIVGSPVPPDCPTKRGLWATIGGAQWVTDGIFHTTYQPVEVQACITAGGSLSCRETFSLGINMAVDAEGPLSTTATLQYVQSSSGTMQDIWWDGYATVEICSNKNGVLRGTFKGTLQKTSGEGGEPVEVEGRFYSKEQSGGF